MRKTRYWGTAALLVLVVLTAAFFPVSGWLVYKKIEKSLKMPVQGEFEPSFTRTSFVVRKAVLSWDNKIALNSGDIRVDYDLFSLVSSGGIRVSMSGKALPVRFLADLSRFSPRENVIVDDFYADLLISGEGLKEVTALRIKSPEIQFQIGLQN